MRGGSCNVGVGVEESSLQAVNASAARAAGPRQRMNIWAVGVVRFIGAGA